VRALKVLTEIGLDVSHVDFRPAGVDRRGGATVLPPDGNYYPYEEATTLVFTGAAKVARYENPVDFNARVHLINSDELGGWFPTYTNLTIEADRSIEEIWHWHSDGELRCFKQ